MPFIMSEDVDRKRIAGQERFRVGVSFAGVEFEEDGAPSTFGVLGEEGGIELFVEFFDKDGAARVHAVDQEGKGGNERGGRFNIDPDSAQGGIGIVNDDERLKYRRLGVLDREIDLREEV